MSSLATPLATAALAGLVAFMPVGPGAQAARSDGGGTAELVCAGRLDVAITAVDDVAVAPTQWVMLHNLPTPSTFTLTHVIVIRNEGSVTVRSLSLVTWPGWRDNRDLASLTTAVVSTSSDSFVTSRGTSGLPVSFLERHPGLAIPLPAPLRPGSDLQIKMQLSANDLDNALQGASITPSMIFVAGA